MDEPIAGTGRDMARPGRLSLAAMIILGLGQMVGPLPLRAEGGALPRGKIDIDQSGSGSKNPVAHPPQGRTSSSGRPSCLVDLMTPPGASGYFTGDGRLLYLLADAGPVVASSKTKRRPPPKEVHRFALYRVDLRRRQADPVLALSQRRGAVLVPTGDPPKALSAMAFVQSGADCREGLSSMVTVPIGLSKGSPVHNRGQFQIVSTPAGQMFFDMEKRSLLELDPVTFQTRSVRTVAKGQRPLYYDGSGSSRLVTWHLERPRGLIQYSSDSGRPDRRLALPPGDRVLQDRGGFAIAHLDHKENTIEFREMPGWTAKGVAAKSYRIKLPLVHSVGTAGISANFSTRKAVVFGNNRLAKKRWQKLYIFDYESGKQLEAVEAGRNQYLDFAAVDPLGRLAVLEYKDLASDRTVGLKIYDFATGKLQPVAVVPGK